MYTLDIFEEGNIIICAKCQNRMTVQFDEVAPAGWWTLFDSKKQLNVFCSLVCITKFLSKYDTTLEVQAVERPSTFGEIND